MSCDCVRKVESREMHANRNGNARMPAILASGGFSIDDPSGDPLQPDELPHPIAEQGNSDLSSGEGSD